MIRIYEQVSADGLASIYADMVAKYPVVSIEDAFDQDDWPAWTKFSASTAVQVVGDDLTVTNVARIRTAVERRACNCLLLKVNQIGSVSESLEACALAQRSGWGVMVSHRSGETEDSFIADLAVGLGTGQVSRGRFCLARLFFSLLFFCLDLFESKWHATNMK
jgi:enolase